MIEPGRVSPGLSLLVSAALVVLGMIDVPPGRARTALQSVQSQELNRADRESGAGGYYEDLISGGVRADGSRDEIALRLLGKPTHWVSFHDMKATHYMPGDFLQFDLFPSIHRPVFDHTFTTNAIGLRDREGYTLEKPPGVFRIVLLGSSMDMGWGVATDKTYENQLEDWLNHYAETRGVDRRFEVLNFAMAAYGPAQRLESFRRKAVTFDPDLVLYSVTMLDQRLTQIHICELLRERADPTYDFIQETLAAAKLTDADLRLDGDDQLVNRIRIKSKLKPHLWSISDRVLQTLAADCRSRGLPLVCVIIPRVGLADAPGARAEPVARHKAIATRHAVPLVDLTAVFDGEAAADLEIAAWDDHPNALGHRLLFLELAKTFVEDPSLAKMLFGP